METFYETGRKTTMSTIKISILIFVLSITYANCCDCPVGYESGDSCKISLQRLPCNTTVPKCKCPDNYTPVPNEKSYFVCAKSNEEIQCENAQEFRDFVSKIAAGSTWNVPTDRCFCEGNFKVMKNGKRVLCENPHSNWIEIPCGFRAPPVCKCGEGMIYGLNEDQVKAGYNNLYGCVLSGGGVGNCLNEDEFVKYFEEVVQYLS